MYEYVISLLVRNESVTFLVVEPLYCTFVHFRYLQKNKNKIVCRSVLLQQNQNSIDKEKSKEKKYKLHEKNLKYYENIKKNFTKQKNYDRIGNTEVNKVESGKHKKRINYTVMIVSDSPDGGIHPFYLGKTLVTALLALIAATCVISVGVAIHHSAALNRMQKRETDLQGMVDKLTEENQTLTAENSELSDKVALLSETVTQNEKTMKEQEREEEEKKIPNGFPLAGPAVILESSETQSEAAGNETADGEETVNGDADGEAAENGNADGEAADAGADAEPIVVFSASAGTKVIATASGIVAAAEPDAAYGYRIVLDHGNGYTSIYRAVSEPEVSEGDEVERGSALYEMQSPEEKLGYQITKDGELIDPLELLEVYG